jgi:hypothetical protein
VIARAENLEAAIALVHAATSTLTAASVATGRASQARDVERLRRALAKEAEHTRAAAALLVQAADLFERIAASMPPRKACVSTAADVASPSPENVVGQ